MTLVATDLDGTLVRSDGSVSAYSADVLAKHRVVLVTGRPIRWLSTVYSMLREPLPPAVCANGAVVYDPSSDSVLHAAPLASDLLAEVCGRLRAIVPDVVFAVEAANGRRMRHEPGYPLRWDLDDPSVSVGDLFAEPAVKLLVRAGERDPDELVESVGSCVDGLAEATHSSYSGLVEISAAGVTKASGLAWLCTRLGIVARDVVAFGDMPNDVPMLAWAGHAVAVANAHPAVKGAADEVTLSNDEDGVAVWLSTHAPDPALPRAVP